MFTFASNKLKTMKFTLLILGVFMSVASFAINDKDNSKTNENTSTSVTNSVIKGQVIDKLTGDALTGVSVRLNDGTEVFTDFEGTFVFENLNPGKYQIQTEYISYENVVLSNIACDNEVVKTLKIQLNNL
jgi:protocatechuate 3,4-dioxygenase beta subunit